MNQSDSSNYKTKEKDKFELGLYDKKGYLNKQLIRAIGFWIFCLIWFCIIYISNASQSNLEGFFSLYWQKEFFMQLYRWFEYSCIQAYDFNFHEIKYFLVYLFVSAALGIVFHLWFKKKVKSRALIQSYLSSLGLSNYYMTRFDKNQRTIYFKLISGEIGNFNTFVQRKDDLKQFFKIGDFEIERYDIDCVKIIFKEELLTISTVNNDYDFTKLIKNDRVLLGIKSNVPEPVYMSKKEEGLGLLNGNALIVGGSGSGKSWLMEQFIKNYLLESNYKKIDTIYIINYKASADYNFIKGLDKVLYAEDIENGLKLLKKAYLDMICRYRYNSVNNQANFTQFQQLIIIDEVQTLNEMLDSKSLHRLLKNSISESLSLLEIMGSKIRASNGSLINILQKADVSSLPSTAYRSNLRNRIMLKQENISSAHLVVNMDITEKNNINPLELKQGQFIYWDMLTNEIQKGFGVNNKVEFNIDKLNNLAFEEQVQLAIEECKGYKEISIKTVKMLNKKMDTLVDEGKKTFYDNFEDLDGNGEIDMFELAKEELNEKKAEPVIQELKTKKNEFSDFLKQRTKQHKNKDDFIDSIK